MGRQAFGDRRRSLGAVLARPSMVVWFRSQAKDDASSRSCRRCTWGGPRRAARSATTRWSIARASSRNARGWFAGSRTWLSSQPRPPARQSGRGSASRPSSGRRQGPCAGSATTSMPARIPGPARTCCVPATRTGTWSAWRGPESLGSPGVAPESATWVLHDQFETVKEPQNQIDVKPDGLLLSVFKRTGLLEEESRKKARRVARKPNREFPRALERPAWRIGQRWCLPSNPIVRLVR